MFQEKTKVEGSLSKRSSNMRSGLILGAIVLVAATTVIFAGNANHWSGTPFGAANIEENAKNLVPVKVGSVDLKISATGVIKPYNEVKISPKVTGLLSKLLVKQGQIVKKGQMLALMDDSNLIGQVAAASSAYSMAKANYEKSLHGNRPEEVANAEAQLAKNENIVRFAEQAVSRSQAQVKSCQAQLTRDATNSRRLSVLAKQGAISDQDRLNATTQAEMTEVTLKQAQQELRQSEASLAQATADLESSKQQYAMSKKGNREEDVRAAKFAMEQAEGNYHYLQSQLNDTRIRAPFAGVISQKYADEGAIVTPTTSAATTSATSSSIVALAGDLELVAQVSETDMEHIKVGQPVEIVANAYPEKTFHGKVNLIAPEAVVTLNVTTFEVHTTIDDDPKHFLMAGMNVNSEFLAGKQDDVLLVPTSCIMSQMGKTGVLIPDKDGQPKFRAVKTGPTSGTSTVIMHGLKEGDKVFVGLNKDQLEKQGYSDPNSGSKGPQGGSGRNKPPIPRGFGGK
jgi:HlyD family secretion protein